MGRVEKQEYAYRCHGEEKPDGDGGDEGGGFHAVLVLSVAEVLVGRASTW